ncbi:MAG: XdhC family protein [Clostridiales bacterium]|nr:XdhC family protein [Clostridiales bacterium]
MPTCKRILSDLENGQPAAVLSRHSKAGKASVPVDASEAQEILSGRASLLLSQDDAQFIERLLPPYDPEALYLLEAHLPKPRLVILGCGHIATALCKVASLLGFAVWAYDDRPYFASKVFLPDAAKTICDGFGKIGSHIKINSGDYVAIMTRGHRHDNEVLGFALSGEMPFYLGMVGSKKRVLSVKTELAESGVPKERLDALHAPIGLEINSVTPEEIAVSIAAELIKTKRAATGGKKVRIDNYADMDIITRLASLEGKGGGCACLTVARTIGSAPREAGAKMIVDASGQTHGTIGGGCMEAEAIAIARSLPPEGYVLASLDLSGSAEEDGMACGGRMDILIERVE